MDAKFGGKLLAFLLFATAVGAGALWMRDQVRDVRRQFDGLKDNFHIPAPTPTATAPASLPCP